MLFLLGLLILSIPALLAFNYWNVRYIFSWLLGSGVSLVVWLGILISWVQLPEQTVLLRWEGVGVEAPALLLDTVSWPFALALAGLGFGVILTGAQRTSDTLQGHESGDQEIRNENWTNLGAILELLALGLVGVLAANPLTLMMAWAAVDALALWTLLVRITSRQQSEQIVLDFSARATGILLLIWAMIAARAEGVPLQFDQVSTGVNVYLLLACGFRMGVLPLQVYIFQDTTLRRGVGSMTRLTMSAAVNLVFLVRIASAGIPANLEWLLSILTLLTGLYAGFYWLTARNEIEGRAFWVLGMGALAMAAAIHGKPDAVQAWGLSLLLGGGVLMMFSARSLGSRLIVGVGGLMMTGLPWMPSMRGMEMYQMDGWLTLPFVLVHALLLAGFMRHLLREGEIGQDSVRAVRAAYGIGLFIPPVTLVLAWWVPGAGSLPAAWWISILGTGLAAALLFWSQRGGQVPASGVSIIQRVFSLHWLYRLLWRGYRLVGGIVVFVSVLLEGTAGVLWALLLLFLLISLVTSQAGIGG